MFLQASHIQTKTMQPKYDSHALVASKIIEMIFKYLNAKFIWYLINSLENKI
jgi:hypothetical protein